MRDVEHFSPETLDEAAALLLAAGDQTRALARGTDLIAEVIEGQRTLCMVLDLKRIPELNRLDYDERNGLRVGAAVPVKTTLQFPPIRQIYPMLADAFVPIGQDELPDSATLGGDLGDAPSAAEIAPPLICLRASAAVFGPYGWSEVGVEALLAGAGRIVLQPGEFAVDLRFPAPPPRSNGAYLRAAPRQRSDAVAGVGAFVVLDQDLATCCGARLTVCGVTPKPMRALEAERFLSGKLLGEAILNEAADLTARCVPRIARSTEEGLGTVRELTRRAITGAQERARAASH